MTDANDGTRGAAGGSLADQAEARPHALEPGHEHEHERGSHEHQAADWPEFARVALASVDTVESRAAPPRPGMATEEKVVEVRRLVRLARRTRGIIMQNFAGTLTVDAVGIVLAAFAFLNPLVAAFIHVTSELTFILNSTRLPPAPRRD